MFATHHGSRGITVIPSAILGRYAGSLVDVVFEKNVEQKVTEDLAAYSEIFRAVPDIIKIFYTPSAPKAAKEKILGELLTKYPVHQITSNFLRVILQHNRIRFFEQIRESYLKLVNERKGIVSARVTSAVALSPEELKNLVDRLAGVTGKLVNLESQTDAGLLGGIVIQMGSTIFDGSLKTQIDGMKRRLVES
jgi:F-type H+-transporting ATPase subunit delta